jgi:hypothetical protein
MMKVRWMLMAVLVVGAGAAKESNRPLDRSVEPRPPKPASEPTVPDGEGFFPLPGGTVNIIGGTATTIAEHPWQVALLDARQADATQAQFCGGTLVDRWWVVTAAHCLMGESAENIDVLMGTADLGNTSGAQRIRVAEIIIHPRYNDFNSDSDIALLRLSAPADPARVLLPLVDEAALTNTGVLATVSGWGRTVAGSSASAQQVLRDVDVPLVSLATANATTAYAGSLTANMLPAGLAAGGKDSCQGDSGGPLTVPSPVGPGRMLAGVVSFGEGCGQPNAYGIYTRVSVFREFVLGHIWPNYSRFESTAGQIGELRDRNADGWTLWDDFVLPGRRSGVEIAGGETLVTYDRGPYAGEASVGVEFSPDLQAAWTGISTLLRPSVAQGGGLVRERLALVGAPVQRGFLRLRPGRSGALAFGPRPLEIPGSATGALESTDPEHPGLAGHRMKLYRLIGGVAGTSYSISLRSGSFDARLEIIDPDGNILSTAISDAGLGRTGKDEVLNHTVTAGQERWLRVTSEVAGQTGDFEIGVWNPATLSGLVSLAPGGGTTGASLNATSDAANSWFLPGETIVKDDYALNFTSVSAGQMVELRMTGTSSADELIMLMNAETGQLLGVGDDFSPSVNDGRVHFMPVPGVKYLARATAYAATTGTQSYALNVLSPPNPSIPSLTVPFSGPLALSSVTDRYDSGTSTYYDDVLLNSLAAGTRVRVRLNSTAFDTFLSVIEASSLRVIDTNDDLTSGDFNNSGIDFTAKAGERYFVRVSSYDEDATGNYTLSSQILP